MESFEFLCRICGKLKCHQSHHLFSARGTNILRAVEELTGIMLSNTEELPQHACQKCIQDLRKATEFRRLCLGAQEYFSTSSYRRAVILAGQRKNDRCLRRIHNSDPAATSQMHNDNKTNIATVDKMNIKYDTDTKSVEDETITSTYAEEHILSVEDFHGDEEMNVFEELVEDEHEIIALDCEPVAISPNEVDTTVVETIMEIDNRQENADVAAPAKGVIRKKQKTSYVCDKCGCDFNNSNHFRVHLDRHANRKTRKCKICPSKFYTNTELTRHMRHHTGERPYACKYCEKSFGDYSSRLKHERIHNNERPYVCIYCTKAYIDSYHLKRHLISHTGERNFHCTLCNKSFQLHKYLSSHYRSQHHKQNQEKIQVEDDNITLDKYDQKYEQVEHESC